MNTVTFHLKLCLAPLSRSRCGCECGCWSKRADAGAAVGLSSYVDRAKNFACSRFFSPQYNGMFAEIFDIHCIHRLYTSERALSPAPAPSAYWYDQPGAYWYDQPSACGKVQSKSVKTSDQI